MPEFSLHEQLEADSLLMRDLALCQLRLQNQRAAPWLILVPRRAGMRELYQLEPADRAHVDGRNHAGLAGAEKLYAPDKINVAALGNLVPQLHIHVIARFTRDAAWPQPVWGKLSMEPYELKAVGDLKKKLNDEGVVGK